MNHSAISIGMYIRSLGSFTEPFGLPDPGRYPPLPFVFFSTSSFRLPLSRSLINSLRDHARQGGGEVRRRKGAGTGGSGGGGGIEDVDDVAAIVSSSTSFAGTTSTTDRKLSNDWDKDALFDSYSSLWLRSTFRSEATTSNSCLIASKLSFSLA